MAELFAGAFILLVGIGVGFIFGVLAMSNRVSKTQES